MNNCNDVHEHLLWMEWKPPPFQRSILVNRCSCMSVSLEYPNMFFVQLCGLWTASTVLATEQCDVSDVASLLCMQENTSAVFAIMKNMCCIFSAMYSHIAQLQLSVLPTHICSFETISSSFQRLAEKEKLSICICSYFFSYVCSREYWSRQLKQASLFRARPSPVSDPYCLADQSVNIICAAEWPWWHWVSCSDNCRYLRAMALPFNVEEVWCHSKTGLVIAKTAGKKRL